MSTASSDHLTMCVSPLWLIFSHQQIFIFIILYPYAVISITLLDLQLKPYRTDDFITKLFYETGRFSAFNNQWVIRAKVTHDQKDPAHSAQRALTYQLVLKSKITQPIVIHFVILKGPFGDMKVNPAIYKHEFTADILETTHHDLPIVDSIECNKLLASKTINLRVLMFQVNS